MATASKLGIIESNFEDSTAIQIGDSFEMNGLPRFETTGDGLEVAKIPTTDGLRHSFSKVVIGQLRSENPKSVGGAIKTALAQKETLSLWVARKIADKAHTSRDGISLSLFPPKAQ